MSAPARSAPWLSGEPGQWLLTIQVQPGARSSEVVGEHGGALKIRIAAAPLEGKANEALLRWLSQRLDIPIRSLVLASGGASRAKRIRMSCALTADEVIGRLGGPPF